MAANERNARLCEIGATAPILSSSLSRLLSFFYELLAIRID